MHAIYYIRSYEIIMFVCNKCAHFVMIVKNILDNIMKLYLLNNFPTPAQLCNGLRFYT